MHKGKLQETVNLLTQIKTESAPAAFANSLGAEDMVLMDLIVKHARSIEIFTIDTGRLPAETYELISVAMDKYGKCIKVFFPDTDSVEAYIKKYGPNGFYQSVDLRKSCCHIRKVIPLQRALSGKNSWITGLRKGQAVTRKDVLPYEWDRINLLKKYNPLYNWSESEVWDYIEKHSVPYNKMHKQGYPSIGCAPCTRAVQRGEDVRAGRWWWEPAEQKECGLHDRNVEVAEAKVDDEYNLKIEDIKEESKEIFS